MSWRCKRGFRWGSADGGPTHEELAHVHEHMVFKGTKRFEQGAIDNAVASLGGEINAWTSFDETVYHLVLPNEATETGMQILAELIQRPRLEAADLRSELEVVAEEIREDQDSPSRKLSQALFSQAYGAKHPHGRRRRQHRCGGSDWSRATAGVQPPVLSP